MRLFQNSGIYPAYRPRLQRLVSGARDFRAMRQGFLDDRYGACHFLQPVLDDAPEAFFTNGDDEALQRLWAREHGLKADASLEDILLAQIEEHRTEVFYNMDPMRYASPFVRRLPGCVRHSIAWRAAPSPGADFEAYGRVVCNFPSILEGYRQRGWRAAYFAPAHDPAMDPYADNRERPVDVLFVGGYTRHHRQRAEVLEAVARLHPRCRVVFHLDRSRATRWAESWVGRMLPLEQHRRPQAIRDVTADPVFGRDLYRALSQAKIVLNGAVDMAGDDRGNMRCWEAMGCGALLVSDQGRYPDGMQDGQTLLSYRDAAHAAQVVQAALAELPRLEGIRDRALALMREQYGKAAQWAAFRAIVESM